MQSITSTITKKPAGQYWVWTTLGFHNVNLDDTTVQLPPGVYKAHWDFRGDPGDALEFSISLTNGPELVTVSDTIPLNHFNGGGSKYFTVPKE